MYEQTYVLPSPISQATTMGNILDWLFAPLDDDSTCHWAHAAIVGILIGIIVGIIVGVLVNITVVNS